MKKLMIALSVAALFSGSVMANKATAVEVIDTEDYTPTVDYNMTPVTNGTIEFSGMIYPETCSIKGGNQKVVKLPNIGSSKFTGQKSSEVNFSIDLENCAQQNRFVTLELTPDSKNITEKGNLKNLAEDGAGVAIEVSHSNAVINFATKKYDSSRYESYPDQVVGDDVAPVNLNVPGPVSYAFSVKYIKENMDEKLKPGAVQATLPFTIVYK